MRKHSAGSTKVVMAECLNEQRKTCYLEVCYFAVVFIEH